MYCSTLERLVEYSTSKSVPPTATFQGVDAKPFTARPEEAAALKLTQLESQPADPESPEETVIDMPWAAACS